MRHKFLIISLLGLSCLALAQQTEKIPDLSPADSVPLQQKLQAEKRSNVTKTRSGFLTTKKKEQSKEPMEDLTISQTDSIVQDSLPKKNETAKVTSSEAIEGFDSLRVRVKSYEQNDFEELKTGAQSIDLKDPENIKTNVEYDPHTGNYVLHTRIGEMDIATPYLMTKEEYSSFSERQQMQSYWREKNFTEEHDNEKKFDITDMKFNIGPADRIFGPGGVQLKLQGSAELLFGFKHQFIDNPSLTSTARNNNIFDFDEKIQVSVNAKVGDKLAFNMNYNTESSFSFDQQNIKLNYQGKEDDIIQSLEAGNVSMQLNSSLISGSSALFGVKANLKFGKLSIQALLSQQNTESKSVSSEGGAQTTSFEVDCDKYDENRHFFLSYYFRDKYESSLEQLPYIASGVSINRIEVWITNKRGSYDNSRNFVAMVDLGEAKAEHILGSWGPHTGPVQPYNKANTLYDAVRSEPQVRDISLVGSFLQSLGMETGEDFEKVESARLLNENEYTLNSTLGYISLKSALNQDEVLAVAYEYTYGGEVYQVGEFSTDNGESTNEPPTLILKMLKGTGNAPSGKKGAGTWDLMMKNIYSIGAQSMQQEKFELYIMYRNDSVGTELQYLEEGNIKGKQLLRVMNLDRLDTRQNRNSDGKFDYIEGYTVLSSNGRIIFPVLEPFGKHLQRCIGDDNIAKKYVYQELYDSTLIQAQELSEKNKFTIKGKYKGSSSNQIQLNAMNVPRGSVKVTAGGATLIENVDYTVDYTMGTVTILNESILESGTNVDVQLENQSTFSMKRKTLLGTHLEYAFNKDLVLGGTLMYMNERPLTTKVNSGQEPISNLIWGINFAWKQDLPWLTNFLNLLPFTTATAPSTLQVNAEFAHMVPGHTRDVTKEGQAYIDDFEATKTNIDVHYPNYWFLASTPGSMPESKLINNIEYNKNRAHIAWYAVDPIFGYPQSNTPLHIKNDPDLMSDHRTRIVYEQELYPNKESLAQEDTRLTILNLSYYPKERGQYNISAAELNARGELKNPTERWGGLMRKLDNTDFEASNIEYIEFWLMDPLLTNTNYTGGKLYINLGDISEDILHDGKKAFEHGIPVSDNTSSLEETVWGRVSKTTSTTVAFSNESGAREKQDVGLDGLQNEEEKLFGAYKQYLDTLPKVVSDSTLTVWKNDPFSPFNDPAGDNYQYYRGSQCDEEEWSILRRYKYYNGTEGNSPTSDKNGEGYGTAATLTPDIEDINNDNTLNEYEKYFEYAIPLTSTDFVVGRNHITQKMVRPVHLKNGNTVDVTWYQFKIPISAGKRIGSIKNFKNIRFMRMYLTGFAEETHLRFGTMALVRGEWRTCTKPLYPIDYPAAHEASLDVQAVNIEENGNRTPVNYVLPPGVSRQTDPGQAQLIAQNEQAMVLRVDQLCAKDARAVYKNLFYDMRNYKKLQMFVHAEKIAALDNDLSNGELSCFIRLGSDMVNNYYEYEIPLNLTAEGIYNNDNENDRTLVWPVENMFDFEFSVLTDAKSDRNKAKRNGTPGVNNNTPYYKYDDANGKSNNRITVMGNPTLGEIETIMIGVRNNSNRDVSGEVWVNELRMAQFNEDGGVAAMANVALNMSDIAQFNIAGRLETAGYGNLESNVQTRNIENLYQLSLSAALEAGRLLPEKAKIQLPLYVAYTNETTKPKYDPLDTDIELEESLKAYETKSEKDSIKSMSNTIQTSTSFTVTNAKFNIHSKKKNMFYDPANFSVSASYNTIKKVDPEVSKDYSKTEKASFVYAYNFNPKPWEPFKNFKALDKPAWKWIKEFNIYYLPQSWGFSTDMNRNFTQMQLRDFSVGATASEAMDITFSKDFLWNRNVDFKYDLTKNMKFSFQTAMNSTIDEGLYTPEIIKDYEFSNNHYEAWKDTIQRSLAKWGQPYTYQQVFTASWNVPFNRFVFLDWINANAAYNATYAWNRTASSSQNFGNTVSSLQSWQVDGSLNFETLYNKSKYLKSVNQRYSGKSQKKRDFKPKSFTQTISIKEGDKLTVNHRLGSQQIEVFVTDSTGKKLPVKFNAVSNTQVELTTDANITNATLKVTTKDPNQRTPARVFADCTSRFLMLIRRVQATYRETNSLVAPGFMSQAGFMGQQKIDGVYAPGFDFAFGFIPENFVEKSIERHWLSDNDSVVQPIIRAKTSDFDVKINLEPLPGFKIQINGKRYEANSTSINYSATSTQENFTGSFNITQVAIATAFEKIGTEADGFSSETYTRFQDYRDVMTARIQKQYEGTIYPNKGFINRSATTYAGKPYSGRINRSSADVVVPAFLAAYTGKDINTISMNPILGILKILPNWSVSYDGLGKLPWMRDHFKSITLTHAYVCKYSIASYTSFSTWVPLGENSDKTLGFVRNSADDSPIASSAYDISAVTLSEQFSPLIGLNLTMKNSLTTKFEYRKQRNISLNVTSVQMTEGLTDEFVIGAGYTIKDFDVILKLKSQKTTKVKNDLKFSVDVSYKNIKTLLRKIDTDITQASSGNKVFGIKIAVDYVLSSKVNLQLYYDHQSTTPLISTSYPVKSDNVGINIKLLLTR